MPTRSRSSIRPTGVGRAGVAGLSDFESGCQFCWAFRPESVLAPTGVEGAGFARLSDLESVFGLIEAFDTWMLLAESVNTSFAIWLSIEVGRLLIVHP
jgi:hypothetical protein